MLLCHFRNAKDQTQDGEDQDNRFDAYSVALMTAPETAGSWRRFGEREHVVQRVTKGTLVWADAVPYEQRQTEKTFMGIGSWFLIFTYRPIFPVLSPEDRGW